MGQGCDRTIVACICYMEDQGVLQGLMPCSGVIGLSNDKLIDVFLVEPPPCVL